MPEEWLRTKNCTEFWLIHYEVCSLNSEVFTDILLNVTLENWVIFKLIRSSSEVEVIVEQRQ